MNDLGANEISNIGPNYCQQINKYPYSVAITRMVRLNVQLSAETNDFLVEPETCLCVSTFHKAVERTYIAGDHA